MPNSLMGSVVVIIGLYILLWGKNKELENSSAGIGDPVQDLESRSPTMTFDSNDQKLQQT